MPSGTISSRPLVTATLPGHQVLFQVRRLIVTAVIAGFGYSVFSVGSRGGCPGGIAADGGFIDRLGNPTDVAPSCINVTLRPNPLVYLVLALIVVWAVTRVTRNVQDVAVALRTLERAQTAVIVVAILALALTITALSQLPLEAWDGTSTPPLPRWLVVDVEITPMQGG